MEDRIQKIMKNLDCSREDALKVIEDDRKIDKGEKLFELTAEQKKASKDARQVARKPTVYKFEQKRTRKADNEKAEIMQMLAEMLKPVSTEFELTNPERECVFVFKDRKLKITLSAPRKQQKGVDNNPQSCYNKTIERKWKI